MLGESKLKKKLIYRVAALYSVVAWVVLQIADVVQEPLGLPEWFMTTLIALIAGGFLIALGIGWLIQPGQETRRRRPTGKLRPLVGRGRASQQQVWGFETVVPRPDARRHQAAQELADRCFIYSSAVLQGRVRSRHGRETSGVRDEASCFGSGERRVKGIAGRSA